MTTMSENLIPDFDLGKSRKDLRKYAKKKDIDLARLIRDGAHHFDRVKPFKTILVSKSEDK